MWLTYVSDFTQVADSESGKKFTEYSVIMFSLKQFHLILCSGNEGK